MAEAHDRCPSADCLLGYGHVGWCSPGASAPVAPVAPTAHGPTEVEQLLVDLADAAREHDDAARHHQRAACDARRVAAVIAAWREKTTLAPTGASNTGRGSNP